MEGSLMEIKFTRKCHELDGPNNSYWAKAKGRGCITLCDNGVLAFFDVPEHVDTMYLVFSNRYLGEDSYHLRFDDSSYFRFDDLDQRDVEYKGSWFGDSEWCAYLDLFVARHHGERDCYVRVEYDA
jgi:hypothetical protein